MNKEKIQITEDILEIADEQILLGSSKEFEIHVAKLFDFTEMTLPIKVIRGRKPGPTLFVSAAIHGDEINGVEIIRRLVAHKFLKKLQGTLITVPIVNVYGFNNKSRYLPDRRDLNRCFPGSERGSLGSQLAKIFHDEVVLKSDYGIDLHTGAIHRTNLPQIRAFLGMKNTEKLARSFGAPVILDMPTIEGSLRELARKLEIPVLVFEGGEALRFEETVIKSGLKGVLSVMYELGMIESNPLTLKKKEVSVASSSKWVRSPHSGIFRAKNRLGDTVSAGQSLGIISNPFGTESYKLIAEKDGIIIGASKLPLVNEGDAIFNIASFDNINKAEGSVEIFEELSN